MPRGFPECPERIESAEAGLRRLGWQLVERPDDSPDTQQRALVEAVHTPEYLARFEHAVARGARFLDGSDNPISAGTSAAAWGAVTTALEAARATLAGETRHAFSLTRPPGHHCERDRAMGFCFLNQVAVVAEHLLRTTDAERIAIVDFDVHHGNGTQHLFEERADVFYLSLHQWPFYPGTGAREERGVGAGEGCTLNLPLPAGTGDEGFLEAFEDAALPALRDYGPDLLLVSAGFDAWRGDPLGGMNLSAQAYCRLGTLLAELADERCGDRLVSVLEGGYDLAALADLVDAYLAGAAGVRYSRVSQ